MCTIYIQIWHTIYIQKVSVLSTTGVRVVQISSKLFPKRSQSCVAVQRTMAEIARIEPAPNKTLYVRNLDESIKLPVLKQDLHTLFSRFGNVINVVAHKNIRMRGQAFIVFEDLLAAQKALGEIQDFPF